MGIRKSIAKYIIFPLENRGANFWSNLRMLERSQWFSSEEIRNIQWNKMQKLLKYSFLSIPYYQKLSDKEKINISDITSLDDLQKLPCLSKKIIRDNIDNMLSVRVDKNKIIKRTTSGSTGEPVSIYRDIYANHIHTAAGWRFRRWAEHDVGDKYARIWGDQLKNESVKKQSLKSRIRQIMDNLIKTEERLRANETISDSVMENFFQIIIREGIHLLAGYASSIYYFARYVNKLHPGEIQFKSVRPISEMLFDYQRELIEKVFDCKVFDTYGNRENGLIAAECSHHNGYHINAENLYVEIVDQAGRPVAPGESGEIAITDLNNYATPLIRYLTGDMGSISPKLCLCGRGLPLINKIEGRIVDTIMLSDGSLISGVFLSAFFIKWDVVEQFQFKQNKKGEVDLLLKLTRPFIKNRFEYFKESLNSYLNNRISINYYIVDEIPLHKSGKHKYIISNINN